MYAIATLVALALAAVQDVTPKANYHDDASLESALKGAVGKDPSRGKLGTIGKSFTGKPIWLVTLSEGDDRAKSAILVIAGANGTHLVGTEMALGHAESLLERAGADAKIGALLKEHAIYIVPRLDPDGAAFLFGSPKREQAANLRPVDDDRDRRVDEDGPDDADGDGLITMMRIPDSKGDYRIDTKDPRIMVKADRAKGERGTHRLVPEGLDDDGDGSWNEDGPGGVRIDRNFPHNWKEHDRATGTSPVSESESRALADFLLDHTNIGAVVVYGLHDNVRKAPRGEAAAPAADGEGADSGAAAAPAGAPGGGRGGRGGRGGAAGGGAGGGGGGGGAATTILRDDLPIYERAAKLYKETTALDGDVEEPAADGAIHAWTYFERGLPSFAIRVWTPQIEKPKDTASAPASRPAPGEGSGPAGGRGRGGAQRGGAASQPAEEADSAKAERTRLEWNDKTLGGSGFVAWKAATQPALKEKGIEIGGWKPGILVNPPAGELAELERKHNDFLVALLPELFPKVVIADAKLTQEGPGLATLKASIRNDGKGPASTAMAQRAGAVRAIRVKLAVDGGEIVIGRPQYLVSDLDPGAPPREWTWVLKGKPGAKVRLEVNSPFTPESVYTGEIR
jgi:hypothetical protein